jgi:hypothetical protein
LNNEDNILPVNATDELQKFLPAIDNDELDKIPFADSWTGGQVTKHILKATEGFPQLLRGGIEPTHRDPHEHEEQIKDIFLTYDSKLKSPDFICQAKDHSLRMISCPAQPDKHRHSNRGRRGRSFLHIYSL